MGMGWSSNEDLICILEGGTMAAYSIHGHLHYSRAISRVSHRSCCMCCTYIHVHIE